MISAVSQRDPCATILEKEGERIKKKGHWAARRHREKKGKGRPGASSLSIRREKKIEKKKEKA